GGCPGPGGGRGWGGGGGWAAPPSRLHGDAGARREPNVAGEGEKAQRARDLPREGNAAETRQVAAEDEPERSARRGHHAAKGEHRSARIGGHLLVEPGLGQRLSRALKGAHEEEQQERLGAPARHASPAAQREDYMPGQ